MISPSQSERAGHPAYDVVVIDDHQASCELLEEVLRFHGFSVRSFLDASAALQAIRDRPADVIVTDLRMPGMSGIELARMLRADPDCLAGLIAVSGEIQPDDSVARHFDAFFPKPVDTVALPAKVRALAETARGLRARVSRAPSSPKPR